MNNGNVKLVNMEQLYITKCEYQKAANSYGQAVIEGYINEQDYEMVREKIYFGENFQVEEITEQGVEMIFAGRIKSAAFYCDRGYLVKLVLQGDLAKMDMVANTRIFQNSRNQVEEILSVVSSSYQAQYILKSEQQNYINHMVVQYEETDWQFICRVIAEIGGCILPDYRNSGCRFTTGVKDDGGVSITTKEFSINSLYYEYEKKVEQGVSVCAEDQYEYIIKGKWNFELGDKIIFNGKSVYVYCAEGKWEGQELVHYYYLRTVGAFKQYSEKNKNLIGATFEATVRKVQHDKIEVNFNDIEMYGNREYSYATIYSSKEGAGWYCMPEKDDLVTITFATEDPESAYASGSVHLIMGKKDADTKFIRNPFDKEIRFTKDALTITNNKGTEIILSDKDGLIMTSAEEINLTAEKDITITSISEKITVQGESGVELAQGDSKLIVSGDVKLIGEQVHIQNME